MADKKVVAAIVIVVTIILIASMAWYCTYRYRTTLVSQADGSTAKISCQTGQIKVVEASYAPSGGGKAADVTSALQTVLGALGGASYQINAAALGQPAGGVLTFRYKCAGSTKSDFRPVPVSTCGTPYGDQYAVDMTGRNAAGTVVWNPYSTQSRVSLERYAETPEVAETPNPYTGVGKTSSVRAMGDRYRRDEALTRLTVHELQSGQPGYMEEVGDSATSLMASVARRSPAVAGGAPSCLVAGADIDSDFYTDGFYDSAVLKEALTSRRGPMPNTLTASRTGLGSIRLDPRFEPGPQSRVPDGDASWGHGGHAGGPTSGGFGAYRFMPGNNWDWRYVHGFGDGHILGRKYPVEATVTERSEW